MVSLVTTSSAYRSRGAKRVGMLLDRACCSAEIGHDAVLLMTRMEMRALVRVARISRRCSFDLELYWPTNVAVGASNVHAVSPTLQRPTQGSARIWRKALTVQDKLSA